MCRLTTNSAAGESIVAASWLSVSSVLLVLDQDSLDVHLAELLLLLLLDWLSRRWMTAVLAAFAPALAPMTTAPAVAFAAEDAMDAANERAMLDFFGIYEDDSLEAMPGVLLLLLAFKLPALGSPSNQLFLVV